MNYDDTRSLRRASLIAGLALALIAVLSAFGNFVAIQPLVTPGDAAKTAIDISNSEALFRWGITSLILVAVLDIVVAAALLRLFEPVNRSLSITAAWFRVGYAAVYLVAIIQLLVALRLLGDPDQALRAIDAYGTIWLVGLILFGVHLLLIGYLAYRSGFMAKVFGILLVIAGFGYIADGFIAVLVRGASISIGQFTFVGEVALIFWLLIQGTRKDFSDAEAGHQFDPDSRWLAGSPVDALDRRIEILTNSRKRTDMTNAVQPATGTSNRQGARRLWVWPVAILVSFPIGGYLADLVVDGVDSVGAALVGGIIAGLVIGAAEWFALRRWISWLWIAATSIGMAAGLTAGAALVGYGTSRGDILIMGAVTGLGVGTLQALVLSRSRVSGALWWAIANPPAWALGWFVTSYVITRNIQDQFANFGASGSVVFGLLTWLVLAMLFRERTPEPT